MYLPSVNQRSQSHRTVVSLIYHINNGINPVIIKDRWVGWVCLPSEHAIHSWSSDMVFVYFVPPELFAYDRELLIQNRAHRGAPLSTHSHTHIRFNCAASQISYSITHTNKLCFVLQCVLHLNCSKELGSPRGPDLIVHTHTHSANAPNQ